MKMLAINQKIYATTKLMLIQLRLNTLAKRLFNPIVVEAAVSAALRVASIPRFSRLTQAPLQLAAMIRGKAGAFTPTALQHSAQGCQARATLGMELETDSTLTGLHPHGASPDSTPSGLAALVGRSRGRLSCVAPTPG
jgi:hypothetical protein